MPRLMRARIGASGVNVTARADGHAKRIAPTWSLVKRAKEGKITSQQYADEYLKRLDDVPDDTWQWLRDQQTESGMLTLLCFCQDSWFCHTHILIDYLVHRWPGVYSDGRLRVPTVMNTIAYPWDQV